MEKVSGHPRLYRRNATYYHRAAVPNDIKHSYPKSEETFSLQTKDYQEALKLVRRAAAEVDQRFEEHRRELARRIALEASPERHELTSEELEHIYPCYLAHLLDEDEEARTTGFYIPGGPIPFEPAPTFEEHIEGHSEGALASLRKDYARGQLNSFLLDPNARDEVDEVLSWETVGIRLAKDAPVRRRVARKLQEAELEAKRLVGLRSKGEIVPTPQLPEVQRGPKAVPRQRLWHRFEVVN